MTSYADVLALRPYAPADRSFVADSWMRSWLDHPDGYGRSDSAADARELPIEVVSKLIDQYIDGCDRIVIATTPGETRFVGAWAARLGPQFLGYVFVRGRFRKDGVATKLLRALEIEPRGPLWRYAFNTRKMQNICNRSPKQPGRDPWHGVFDARRARKTLEARRTA